MSNPAQEEADRLFSSHNTSSVHPEDHDRLSEVASDEEEYKNDIDTTNLDANTDDDPLHNMSTLTTTKTTFHIPSTVGYANTGPKGVIADARSFARAKQSTFRQKLATIANNIGSKPQAQISEKKVGTNQSSDSESDLSMSEEEADSEFMNSWRAQRLQELSAKSGAQKTFTRRVSPSRRVWGILTEVDANGYLDAVEKVADDTIVVVMIYNPNSSQSAEVEDELGTLAYKYSTTRFVKLHHEIAEMETVQIPAVLAYKMGEVFATVSNAKADGLEGVLKRQNVLQS